MVLHAARGQRTSFVQQLRQRSTTPRTFLHRFPHLIPEY